MSNKCETVIISDKAYNAIIRESFARHPVETGGILLGYILDNGLWVVMEMIPPGINGVFRTAYFEYDRDFVNYLGTSVANQYREPLQVLGLWHRHPGSMDFFSQTDDGTNSDFASKNPYGVISGLVNIDPSLRLTMYHLDHIEGPRPSNVAYTKVEVEVGDDLIPERFFALRYIDTAARELHPTPTDGNTHVSYTNKVPESPKSGGGEQEEMLPYPYEAYNECGSVPAKKCPVPARWRAATVAVMIFVAGIAAGVWGVPKVRKWLKPAENEISANDKITLSPLVRNILEQSVIPSQNSESHED